MKKEPVETKFVFTGSFYAAGAAGSVKPEEIQADLLAEGAVHGTVDHTDHHFAGRADDGCTSATAPIPRSSAGS